MTVEELNALVETAYEAAFEYETELVAVYEKAYARQTSLAAKRFHTQTAPITAAWTPPIYSTLSEGMNEKETAEADRVRDEAAAAILVIFAAAGIDEFGEQFLQAISERAQANFLQEIQRQLRKIVSESFDAGLTSEQTAAAILERLPQVIPASAQMLAQTELTALVNERSMAAAQKQFRGAVSKTWLTVGDNRVRPAHASVQGQTVPVDQPFQIGGFGLMFPGDPNGPLRLVARCRCRLSFTNDPTAVVASAQEDSLMDMDNLGTTFLVVDEQGVDVTSSFAFNFSPNGTPLGFETNWAMPNGQYFFHRADEPFTTITIDTDTAVESAPAEPMEDGPAWKALLAVEGVPTGDGRMLAEGALTWREPPLSLMALDFTGPGGHEGARVAGRIDTVWRDGNDVWAEGVFNGDEFGLHIADLVSNQSLKGNSIDPGGVTTELWDAETMEPFENEEEAFEALMDGVEILTVFTKYEIAASTLCPTPAIADAQIMLASGILRLSFFTPFRVEKEALTASAAGLAPLHPPAAWFENPKFNRLTGLIVTDEGRVMGHAAGWDSCHIAEPRGPGICVPPPRSGMSYEIFHHGLVRTEEGQDIPCGPITMSAFHATDDRAWKEAREHYEHSGCVVADVVAGEDRFGIWVSGALRPDISAERVREFKAGALSGDWRDVIGRGLEFLGALVVNIPGFPIPRPRAVVVASANGEEQVLALTAAGIVPPEPEVEGMSRREYLRKIRMLTD